MTPSPMNFSISPPNARVLTRDQGRSDRPVRVEQLGDLGRRRALRERGESGDVTEEDADVLTALAGRREIEMPEALITPFVAGGKADHEVRSDDQAVPFPPARVPSALTGDGDADHCLREEQEARDDGRRQQLTAIAEDAPVAPGARGIDDRPDDRHRLQKLSPGRLAARAAE